MTLFISLEDIAIQAGSRTLFSGASWTIQRGHAWAVLGPTGAGKSALAAGVSRHLPLVHGQIRFFFGADSSTGRSFLHPGEVAIFSSETHREFLQRYATYHQARWQSLEGEDNPSVTDYLRTKRLSPGAPGIGELVNLLGLEPLLDHPIHRLSHGESRKVCLAGLLLGAPKLLILDDPYTGLDAASRSALGRAIDNLIQRGTPLILFLTSRPENIPPAIGWVLALKDGQFIAKGAREEILIPSILDRLFSPVEEPGKPGPFLQALAPAVQAYAASLDNQLYSYPDELIQMQDVSLRYDQVAVLTQVNWVVRRGERWLISGPNGAGKTSLLSLVLADNPQAYANQVSLFGRRRGSGESIWAIKRAIGWVSPELQAFYARSTLEHPPLTCLQVACSGFYDSVGLFHPPTAVQKEVAAGWLDALDLAGESHQTFQRQSNGQQRLVLLARALVKHPPLLILDEPCQALDAGHRQVFIELLDRLCAAAPLTLLYVTHDPDEYPKAITHRLDLANGKVIINRMLSIKKEAK